MSDETDQFDPGEKAEAPAPDAENRFAVALAKNNEESFPVLQAFQSFLDQERERSRRRITALSAVFMSALVVLMLVFAAFFAVFFTRVISHNEAQQDRMLDLIARDWAVRSAPSGAAEAEAPAAPRQQDIEALVEKLVAERLRAASRAGGRKAPPAAAPAPVAPPAAAAAPAASAPAPAEAPVEAPAPVPAPSADSAAAATPSGRPGIYSRPSGRPAAKPAAKPAAAAGAAEAPAAKPRAEAPAAAPAKRPEPKPAAGPSKPRVVSVKPVKTMSVPGGYEADSLVVQTESGALVPLRTLLPAPAASK